MKQKITNFENLKPGVSKHQLLLIAAVVWTFAGAMLLFRGFSFLQPDSTQKIVVAGLCLIFGAIFYVFMFSKISAKHINRIINLPYERPFFLAFFDARSYLLIPLMIGSGIGLRISDIVPLIYLSDFYIIMGTPLFMSALRFYFVYFRRSKKK
jgi:hypothetical protein